MTDRATRESRLSPEEEARKMLKGSSSGNSSGESSLDIFRRGTELPRPTTRNPVEQNIPRVTDQTRTSDQYAGLVKNGVLELTYGDREFDAKLQLNNYHTLKIKGLPKDMQPSPWVDDSGKGYFFWFKHKNDDTDKTLSDRTRHYYPPNVKRVEIDRQVGHHFKPDIIIADEMRIAATQAYMKRQNDNGFASYGNRTDAFKYGKRMSAISYEALQYQEKLLRDGAKASPDNPYFRLYLSDVLLGQAIKPVIDQVMNPQQNGGRIHFDDPKVLGKIDEALFEARKAREIAAKFGNTPIAPGHEMPLSPFALNPYFYNPDMYWSGAAYQAQRREVQLTILKGLAEKLKLPADFLPPALPPAELFDR